MAQTQKNPVILIHGYSDKGSSFKQWKKILQSEGYDQVHIVSYRSLTNEVTLKDIAEGFERALRINNGIQPDQPFDAIVHSTGMLVLRSWLSTYEKRKNRLKRLVALAPASFGSPLAHKGRSWLGSIFKGNKERGPDFLEAGNLVLDGLELGSKYTWDLAHRDLFNDKIFYDQANETPYVFVFCGTEAYKGLKGAVTNKPGTDGTVRWAGCSLNSRKIVVDFTQDPESKESSRVQFENWTLDERSNLGIPFIPISGLNHASIIENPSQELISLVLGALRVDEKGKYHNWCENASQLVSGTLTSLPKWQQFVVHAIDERGDPIPDFNLQLYSLQRGRDEKSGTWEPVEMDVHAFSSDHSYRCFHINLDHLNLNQVEKLKLEFIASSGSELIGYCDYVPPGALPKKPTKGHAFKTLELDLTDLLTNEQVKFFYPYTTTLIEVILNREPLPLQYRNEVTWFEN